MTATAQVFERKKQKILSDLALPDAEYTDLSPKGSVDAGIRDLIQDINRLQGLVTTSSCAGRISVFIEGSSSSIPTSQNQSAPKEDPGLRNSSEDKDARQFAATGGKGSGKWQFVSHDPVEIDASDLFFHNLFGLRPSDGSIRKMTDDGLQLARFHFEPMILHIMAESLKHAQPVLAAASGAGFRESGLQSLRCLDDPNACPIVAVRSSGLAFESIIGYVERSDSELFARSLVSEEYLRMLVLMANERFRSNFERMGRFKVTLLASLSDTLPTGTPRKKEWEDAGLRRERKRIEGLQRQEAAKKAAQLAENAHHGEYDTPLSFLER